MGQENKNRNENQNKEMDAVRESMEESAVETESAVAEAEDFSETENTVEEADKEPDESTVEAENQSEENSSPQKKEKPDNDKKKKKVLKRKDKKDEQIEQLNDKYQRLFAEFQNYRIRSEKEKTAMYEVGAKSIIEKILPVVDNLERGVAALGEADMNSPVGQGMNLIYKQMLTALEEMGVVAIEAEGKEFDPNLHNAVMHEDNDALGENVVSQELQKGYQYRDTVIRHSMVKVAN